jgi:hypothetical protein
MVDYNVVVFVDDVVDDVQDGTHRMFVVVRVVLVWNRSLSRIIASSSRIAYRTNKDNANDGSSRNDAVLRRVFVWFSGCCQLYRPSPFFYHTPACVHRLPTKL